MLSEQASLEEAARRFHERLGDDPLDRVAEFIHPEARMTLLINDFVPVDGRVAIIAAIARGREDGFHYSVQVERCEWLDEWTALLQGQARHGNDGDATSANVWWVNEFLEGLLWRVESFSSEAAFNESRRAVGDD